MEDLAKTLKEDRGYEEAHARSCTEKLERLNPGAVSKRKQFDLLKKVCSEMDTHLYYITNLCDVSISCEEDAVKCVLDELNRHNGNISEIDKILDYIADK